ncbi:DUF2946 domain-containing protein [Acidovorax sp. SDU_ACID1]|uniref:DUF2946 domain-containing protein n=1 Tax=Acidovorax sp. SDU_ACID1 TaxID=3136632 RepID=UPI0038733A5B
MRRASAFLRHPSTRLYCVWMVALALLWGTLGPVLIPASQAGEGTWVQVCSGIGTKLVRIDDAQKDAPSRDSKSASTLSECPYCRLHLSLALPPETIPDVVRRPRQPVAFSLPREEPHRPAPIWRPALARAPPTTSA